MPLILSTDDSTYTNDGTLNDAPSVRLTGSRVRFINSESGRVISSTNASPAIMIEGNGGTIVNEFGGIIRIFDPLAPATAAAIMGSTGNDVIINSGVINGRVLLGSGNDEFRLIDSGQVNSTFSNGPTVDLGDGDDRYVFAPSTSSSGYVYADGGNGTDRLIMTGPRQNFGGSISNFEILDIQTNGFFESMSGFQRIEVLFANPGHNFAAIRFMNTPLAEVVVGGTNTTPQENRVGIYDRATVGSVTGNAFANTVDIGTDTVIGGAINLGAGDDLLTFFRSQFSNALQQSIGASINGGDGQDTIAVNLVGGDSFNLSNMVNVERVIITNMGQWNEPQPPADYTISVSGISAVSEIWIPASSPSRGSTILPVTLSSIAAPSASLRLGERAIVTLESSVTLGSIAYLNGATPPPPTAPANDALSVNVTNRGTVNGDVQLGIGDDIVDSTGGRVQGRIYGYAGNDRLTGGEGADYLLGGSGADILDGGAGADITDGGTGNDVHYVNNANDQVFERTGEGTADRVITSVSYQLPFNAEVEFVQTDPTVTGSAFLLTGSNTANSIIAAGGADVLTGLGGNDELYGLGGNDQIYGDEGNDYVSGGDGADYLSGGAGDDLMVGGAGADIVLGGAGDDSYYQITPDDLILEYDGQGNDRIYTEVDYVLRSGSYIETLGTTSNAGTDAINLTGNELANTVVGNAGTNRLDGAGGADTLYGGAGLDYFYFSSALGSGNVDTIGDFASVDDLLMIDRRVFQGGGLATGFLDAAAFLSGAGATAATTAAQRFIHNTTTGDLYYDADGTGAQAAVRFANIGAGTPMQNYDLFVI